MFGISVFVNDQLKCQRTLGKMQYKGLMETLQCCASIVENGPAHNTVLTCNV